MSPETAPPSEPDPVPATASGRCLTHGACEHGMNYCVREICLPCEASLDEISARERGCVYVDAAAGPTPEQAKANADAAFAVEALDA